jgi:hypothetical protein
MKKLKDLNLGVNLKRSEMKNFTGGAGIAYTDGGDYACPEDTCSVNSDCPKDNYCSSTTCTISPGYQSSFQSCQWLKNS